MMNRKVSAGFIVLGAVLIAGSALLLGQGRGTPASNQAARVPTFQPDPTFPKVPNNWVLGPASSVAVDRHDNVWLIERPRSVSAENKDRAAPAVVEFDANGNFVQAWGGPGEGYEWPGTEHGIFVDEKDQVWISGSGVGDHILLKFTAKGKFLMQIGKQGASTGNADTKNLNMPADIFVYPKTNEVFVADGYGNRRVIVLDADTGAFKRMWGAFGNKPEGDRPKGPSRGGPPPPSPPDKADLTDPQFDMVHSITVSNDDLVYVVDRTRRRVQVFNLDGEYVSQVLINAEGPTQHSAVGVAFSPDAKQQYLYVGDFGNSQIHTVDRKTLKVLGFFGGKGSNPGEFNGLHDVAVDSKGNLYTAEVNPGARFQRFVPAGTRPVTN